MQDFDSEILVRLSSYVDDLRRFHMPFGRYGPDRCPPYGKKIYELPLEYLAWFKAQDQGFPSGRLGELMVFVHDVKADGAGEIFRSLRNA